MAALMNMDQDQLRQIAAMAVSRFAGMEPGRPVGGTYYLYRTLRQLDYDALVGRLMERAASRAKVKVARAKATRAISRLGSPREEYERRLRELRDMIEAEIRRRLVADRGVEAMARTLRKPLPEDIDFMHASREEMQQLQRGDRAAHACARGAARGATQAQEPWPPGLPLDRPALAVVRGRARQSRSSRVRGRRSPRSWSSPTSPARWRASPASPCSSSTRSPGSSPRCGHGCSSTASTR